MVDAIQQARSDISSARQNISQQQNQLSQAQKAIQSGPTQTELRTQARSAVPQRQALRKAQEQQLRTAKEQLSTAVKDVDSFEKDVNLATKDQKAFESEQTRVREVNRARQFFRDSLTGKAPPAGFALIGKSRSNEDRIFRQELSRLINIQRAETQQEAKRLAEVQERLRTVNPIDGLSTPNIKKNLQSIALVNNKELTPFAKSRGKASQAVLKPIGALSRGVDTLSEKVVSTIEKSPGIIKTGLTALPLVGGLSPLSSTFTQKGNTLSSKENPEVILENRISSLSDQLSEGKITEKQFQDRLEAETKDFSRKTLGRNLSKVAVAGLIDAGLTLVNPVAGGALLTSDIAELSRSSKEIFSAIKQNPAQAAAIIAGGIAGGKAGATIASNVKINRFKNIDPTVKFTGNADAKVTKTSDITSKGIDPKTLDEIGISQSDIDGGRITGNRVITIEIPNIKGKPTQVQLLEFEKNGVKQLAGIEKIGGEITNLIKGKQVFNSDVAITNILRASLKKNNPNKISSVEESTFVDKVIDRFELQKPSGGTRIKSTVTESSQLRSTSDIQRFIKDTDEKIGDLTRRLSSASKKNNVKLADKLRKQIKELKSENKLAKKELSVVSQPFLSDVIDKSKLEVPSEVLGSSKKLGKFVSVTNEKIKKATQSVTVAQGGQGFAKGVKKKLEVKSIGGQAPKLRASGSEIVKTKDGIVQGTKVESLKLQAAGTQVSGIKIQEAKFKVQPEPFGSPTKISKKVIQTIKTESDGFVSKIGETPQIKFTKPKSPGSGAVKVQKVDLVKPTVQTPSVDLGSTKTKLISKTDITTQKNTVKNSLSTDTKNLSEAGKKLTQSSTITQSPGSSSFFNLGKNIQSEGVTSLIKSDLKFGTSLGIKSGVRQLSSTNVKQQLINKTRQDLNQIKGSLNEADVSQDIAKSTKTASLNATRNLQRLKNITKNDTVFSNVIKSNPIIRNKIELLNAGPKERISLSVAPKKEQLFIPQAREGGRYINLSAKPLTEMAARSRVAKALDQSTAATGRWKPTGKRGVKTPNSGYYNITKNKFRDFKFVKGKRVPLERKIIEKRGVGRIDTLGEKRGLKLSKLVKQKGWLKKKPKF